jgi:hypothetical protein
MPGEHVLRRDIADGAVQTRVVDAAQVLERRANVQVGNIDMPMLVWLRWLFKAGAFRRGLPVPLPELNPSNKTCC